MRRFTRALSITLIVGVTAVFVFLAAAVIYLNTAHFRNTILSRANEIIPGTLSMSRHRFSPLNGMLALYDVALSGPSGDVPVALAQLTVQLKWHALLRREIALNRVVIESPQVHLISDQNGKLNITAAVISTEESPEAESSAREADFPFNVIIRDMDIRGGEFCYADPEASVDVRVSDITARASFDLYRQFIRLALNTGELQLNTGQSNFRLEPLHAEGEFEKARLSLRTVETGFRSSKIQLSGSAEDLLTRLRLDAVVNLDTAAADIAALLGWEGRFDGRLRARIHGQGDIGAPHVDARLEYDGGYLFDQKLTGAELKLDLMDRLLTIEKLRLEALGGRLDIDGTLDARRMLPHGWITFDPQPEHLAYELRMTLQQMALGELHHMAVPLSGVVGGEIRIHGRGIDPRSLSAETAVDIEAAGLSAPAMVNPLNVRLTGKAQLSEGVATIHRLNAQSGQTKSVLDMTGTLNIVDQTLAAQLHLDEPDLSDLLGIIGIPGVRGGLVLDADASGSLKQPELNLSLSGTQLGYEAYRIGNVEGTAHLDSGGVLTISALDLENQGSAIHGAGRVRLYTDTAGSTSSSRMDMAIDFKAVEPTRFFSELPVGGYFDGRLYLSGRIRSPEAYLTLQAEGLRVLDHDAGNAGIALHYDRGNIAIEDLSVKRGRSALQASGAVSLINPETFRLHDNPRFELNLSGRGLAVDDFIPAAKGTVDLTARISGSVDDPQGRIDLTAGAVEVGGESIETIRLNALIKERKVHITPLRINLTATDEVLAEGWVAFDRSLQLHLYSDGIALDQFRFIQEMDYAKGDLRFDISAAGSLSDPRIIGAARITHLRLNDQPFEDFILDLDVDARQARLSAALDFDAAAVYSFDTRDFSASIVLRQTELKPYFALLGQPDLTGRLTGVVNARGNADRLKAATATMALSLLEVRFKDTSLIRTERLNAAMENNGFNLQETQFSLLTRGDLMIEGQGQFDGPVALEIRGNIPVDIAAPLTDDLSDLSGRIIIDAQVDGEMARPAINATLLFDKIGCTLDPIGEKLKDFNGQVRVTPEVLIFDGLTGKIGNGAFSIEGRVETKDFTPGRVNLAFNAHQLPVEIPGTMNLSANARLTLQGSADSTSLEGRIEILDGLYYKDVNMNPLKGITQKRRQAAPVRREIQLPYLSNMALNVTITRRNPFVVDNNLAYLEISPDLRIGGTVNNPVANGRAQVETGEIYYSGKTFVVKRGVVDFLNPYAIEPTVDIHSEVTVRRWLITLMVSGTPDNLKVELSSDPPEENADILSLLLLGKTSAELRGGSEVNTQSPGQMMSQLLASTFGEDIKKATGVDILEVETTDRESGEASDLIKVTVGKKLSERLTVKYSVSSRSGETAQRAISEYQFLDNIIVSGFQDTHGIYGGELVFRIEFR